jgi:hypothetical protein
MRRAVAFALLLLAGCSDAESVEERVARAKTSDNGIDCALAGAAAFERACIVERGEDGSLTIRHPDGGFRRLTIADDGRGVITADGAAGAEVQVIADNRIEVTIGEDRYRLPATVGARSPSAP